MQLDHFGEARILVGQPVERLVDFQHVDLAGSGRAEVQRIELVERAGGRAAALLAEAGLGVVDQDAAHLARGHGEEMRAVLPGHVHLDQLDEGFVNDGGRLQGVAGPLAFHVAAGAVAQLLIYERR